MESPAPLLLPDLPDEAPAGVTIPRARKALAVSFIAHAAVIGGLAWLDREPVTRVEQHVTQIALVHDRRDATAGAEPVSPPPRTAVAMPVVTVTATAASPAPRTTVAIVPPASAATPDDATSAPPVLAVATPIAGFDTSVIDMARRDYVTALGRFLQNKAQKVADTIDDRLEGRVIVTFTIDRGGNVTKFLVSQSSGVAALDAAARDVVAGNAPLPPPPAGLPFQTMDIELPVNFQPR